MAQTKVSHGLRLRFEKQADNLLVSIKIYSDGQKMVRLVLNEEEVVWHIIDAATGHVYLSGGENITNVEVLRRSAKKALSKFVGISFDKERREVAKSKYSLR